MVYSIRSTQTGKNWVSFGRGSYQSFKALIHRPRSPYRLLSRPKRSFRGYSSTWTSSNSPVWYSWWRRDDQDRTSTQTAILIQKSFGDHVIWVCTNRKYNSVRSMAAIRGFSLAKIAKIRVAFNTFDTRVASARYSVISPCISLCKILIGKMIPPCREFLRRVSASNLKETNPKCQITTNISGAKIEPTVDVEFSEYVRREWGVCT